MEAKLDDPLADLAVAPNEVAARVIDGVFLSIYGVYTYHTRRLSQSRCRSLAKAGKATINEGSWLVRKDRFFCGSSIRMIAVMEAS